MQNSYVYITKKFNSSLNESEADRLSSIPADKHYKLVMVNEDNCAKSVGLLTKNKMFKFTSKEINPIVLITEASGCKGFEKTLRYLKKNAFCYETVQVADVAHGNKIDYLELEDAELDALVGQAVIYNGQAYIVDDYYDGFVNLVDEESFLEGIPVEEVEIV